MPYVSCPTCGERGKIPSGLIGVRIKCKQCGLSFLVAPPAAKAVGAAAPPRRRAGGDGLGRPVGGRRGPWDRGRGAGRVLLDRAHRCRSGPQGRNHPAAHAPAAPSSSAFAADAPPPDGTHEYKILTPRDKFFDGRFDLARLEEALNHFGRQGWVAKSMLTPHVKGFTGGLEETIIVLLERCKESA